MKRDYLNKPVEDRSNLQNIDVETLIEVNCSKAV